jgi:hypothetical protein
MTVPRTYGVLVGCYPKRWRANGRGDELVAVLLDSAEAAGRRRPSAADCLDVGIHGVGERLRSMGIVVPADVRLRVAQASIVLGSALSIFLMLAGELRVPGLSDGIPPNHLDLLLRQDLGPFLTVGVATYGVWLVLLAMYLLGQVHACRELGLIAVGFALLAPLLAVLTHHQRPPGGLLATLAVLGVGAAVTPVVPAPTPRRRYVTAGAVVAVTATLIGWRLWSLRDIPPTLSRSWLTSRPMLYWNPNGDHLQLNRALAGPATRLLIAAGVAAVIAWAWRPAWLPVVAFVSIPVSCLRLGTTTFSAPHARLNALAWTCAAVGLIVLNYVVATRYVRRLSRRFRIELSSQVGSPHWVTGLDSPLHRTGESQSDERALARVLVSGGAAETDGRAAEVG